MVSLQKYVHLSEQFGRLFRSGLVDVEHPEAVDAANIQLYYYMLAGRSGSPFHAFACA